MCGSPGPSPTTTWAAGSSPSFATSTGPTSGSRPSGVCLRRRGSCRSARRRHGLDPGNAASKARPMSLPSPPRVLVHVPADPPAALPRPPLPRRASAGRRRRDRDQPRDRRSAHRPSAIGPIAQPSGRSDWAADRTDPVRQWRGPDGVWPDLAEGSLSVTVAPPEPPGVPADAITLRLALVDPTGRKATLRRSSCHRGRQAGAVRLTRACLRDGAASEGWGFDGRALS